MRNYSIETKFNEEDTIYTTRQVKDEPVCHICNGEKSIDFHGKIMRCPECNGTGIINTNKFKHIVPEQPYKITKIKVDINEDGSYKVRYKGRCGFEILNRTEDNLFLTKEEAEKRCKELDKEKRMLHLHEITIPETFEETKPSIDKILNKLEYYKQNNKFQKDIIVNKNNVLVDGYINYLICGILNNDIVKVTVEDSKTA